MKKGFKNGFPVEGSWAIIQTDFIRGIPEKGTWSYETVKTMSTLLQLVVEMTPCLLVK